MLTGAFLPEKFKDSDADFNLGVAVGKAIKAYSVSFFKSYNPY